MIGQNGRNCRSGPMSCSVGHRPQQPIHREKTQDETDSQEKTWARESVLTARESLPLLLCRGPGCVPALSPGDRQAQILMIKPPFYLSNLNWILVICNQKNPNQYVLPQIYLTHLPTNLKMLLGGVRVASDLFLLFCSSQIPYSECLYHLMFSVHL